MAYVLFGFERMRGFSDLAYICIFRIFNLCAVESKPIFINRKPFGNVNRWFTTIVNQPQVKAVVGQVTLCEKMAQFDPKKFAEFQVSLNFQII